VQFELYVSWTNLTGQSGTLGIGGLPFTSSNAITYPAVAISEPNNILLSANHILTGYVQNNATFVILVQYPAGGGTATTVPVDTVGSIIIQGVYSI